MQKETQTVSYKPRGAQVMRPVWFILALGAACLVCLGPASARAEGQRRPNIIVIVADDMGYGDLSVHGSKDIATPSIDSLAREGVRFTNGYVSAPQCAPTRCGLLTGRYQQRFGYEYNSDIRGGGLPVTETTLPQRLKAAGYTTGLVGKWHLGLAEDQHPLSRGFDEFFGCLGGSNHYLPDKRKDLKLPQQWIFRNRERLHEEEYLTDAFGREAVSFVRRHKQSPFFLYLAVNAPHGPMEATEPYLNRVADITDPGRRTYAAMVLALDDAVGRILEALRTEGLEEDTLIFFFNDNGGPETKNFSDNGVFRGGKGDLCEGGVRVPFMVQWKGTLPAGKVDDRPVIQLDILPTALVAAGVPLPAGSEVDGVNLLPYLTGDKNGSPHETLYWRFLFGPPQRQQWAIRQADWKLYGTVDGRPALFDLASDPSESTDLAAEQPERVRSMRAAWEAWNAQLMDPAWPQPKARDKPRAARPGRNLKKINSKS